MEKNILDIFQSQYSDELTHRVTKNGVLRLDTVEIGKGIPTSVAGGTNGNLTFSNNVIYYSPNKDFIGQDLFYFTSSNETESITTKVKIDVVSTFKPKAHILILLGEELIKSPVMAIYELIKNSYDADSKSVDVKFSDIENLENAEITITDYGTGITKDVLENVWFEPGTDFRKPIQEDGKRKIKRSPIFWRIPMGEKGVGRFAVHKLGHTIKVISRPAKVEVDEHGKAKSITLLDYELEVEIDWRAFSQSKYLEDVKIEWKIKTSEEEFEFKGIHGTKILIGNLKESWTRGMARQLKRNVISMVSPKNDPLKFKINLDFGNWWLNDFPEFDDVLASAPYKLTALIDEEYNMTFEYHFTLLNNNSIGKRDIDENSKEENIKLKYERNIKEELKPKYREYFEHNEYVSQDIESLIDKISMSQSKVPFGSIMLEINSYDLDSASLRDYTNTPNIIKSTLRDHSGIKVFKGDLRIYDYGDPGNDWLGLDIKRVNNKTWFSNNQIIGFVYLDDERSGALVEKTNREGFIKNEAYDHFIMLLEFILNEFRVERLSDREKWLQYNKKPINNSLESQIDDARALINDTDLSDDEKKKNLLSNLYSIEQKYKADKESLLIPASVGMTASFAIHEIEKLVPRMRESVKENPLNRSKLINQVEELQDYSDGILSVLRKAGAKAVSVEDAIKQAISNYRSRINSRKIIVDIFLDPNVSTVFSDRRLLITMLMNLIDNSIYWLDTVHREQKKIMFMSKKRDNGISIIVADNGPGFRDTVEDLIRPFFSRKSDGIGIGLFMIDTVMIQYGKLNIILDKGAAMELEIPETYTGAKVELKFSKHE
ncbi:MAG TPA: hypothetical protein DCQ50_09010 [Chryseobacterium sp.]|nr:hypothetical protein [Chryseobacterium sp.]